MPIIVMLGCAYYESYSAGIVCDSDALFFLFLRMEHKFQPMEHTFRPLELTFHWLERKTYRHQNSKT